MFPITVQDKCRNPYCTISSSNTVWLRSTDCTLCSTARILGLHIYTFRISTMCTCTGMSYSIMSSSEPVLLLSNITCHGNRIPPYCNTFGSGNIQQCLEGVATVPAVDHLAVRRLPRTGTRMTSWTVPKTIYISLNGAREGVRTGLETMWKHKQMQDARCMKVNKWVRHASDLTQRALI